MFKFVREPLDAILPLKGRQVEELPASLKSSSEVDCLGGLVAATSDPGGDAL
jgi:hypothetical protein